MLGYVKPETPELKVKEFEMYSGYYCGVCKSIGKNHGQLPRLSLSYDAAFLAALIDGLDEKKITFSREHCIIHHIKEKTVGRSKAIDYSADAMLLLGYHKLEDDYIDEGKKVAKLASLAFRKVYKKLSQKYESLDEKIKHNLSLLHEMERKKESNIDKVAEPFAKILEEIVAYYFEVVEEADQEETAQEAIGREARKDAGNHQAEGEPSKGSKEKKKKNIEELKAIRRMGYMLGKWIYIIDALDDLDEDIRGGMYNPFIYRLEIDKEEYIRNSKKHKEALAELGERNLLLYGSDLVESFEKLKFVKNEGIVDNVISLGLLRRAETIIKEIKGLEIQKKKIRK